MKKTNIHIYRELLPAGIQMEIGRKSYEIIYDSSVWKEFPEALRQNFADGLTYALTSHLTFLNNNFLIYHFPTPLIEPYIYEALNFAMPETILVDSKARTSKVLQMLYNSRFQIEFRGRPRYSRPQKVIRNTKNRAIIPFSFGKDSLLTFALCQELGIKPYPIFFREPKCAFENKHKTRLADKFFDEFNVDVQFFPVSAGRLRQTTGDWWGWDTLLTQYTILLIPYIFSLRAKYFFWAHEQSCNEFFSDQEKYLVNPVFEQSISWLLTSNSMVKVMGCSTVISSLIEPIHEIAIMKILHHRYPEYAKYQMSCFSEEPTAKNRRWCGLCSKCARIYIYLLAVGVNPEKVGFKEDMLTEKKKYLYALFGTNNKGAGVYDQSGLGRDEQLLGFYLAYKHGAKGKLMDIFKRDYFFEAKKREKELRQKFFGIHTTNSLSYDLKRRVLRIYQEELKNLV